MMKSLLLLILVFSISCAQRKVLEYEGPDINVNKEFDQVVKVKEAKKPPLKVVKDEVKPTAKVKKPKKQVGKKPSIEPVRKDDKKPKSKKASLPEGKDKSILKPHLPKIEDGEGFDGRRPLVDPFRVGEKVTLAMTYWNMRAGDLVLETLPYKEVNGKVAYHFSVRVKSSPFFSKFYKVDDKAETLIDFDTMRPYTMTINVKETSQLKDIRSFFDWKKLQATYWERKVRADSKREKKKKIVWDIKDFSQNVLSAPFYLRAFQLRPGKKLKFPVADDGKNITFSGEVLRRETLKTDVGTFKTVVVKPKITVNGVFKQMGDIFIWLTDDDRKLIVRIEAKIKIGSLIGKLKSIKY